MKTSNEFYQELKNMQAACEAQLKADAAAIYGDQVNVHVVIDIHQIPYNMMPDASHTQIRDDAAQYLQFSEGAFTPGLYSKHRKIKIVFEDEPESNIQNPRLTDAVGQAVTSNQP